MLHQQSVHHAPAHSMRLRAEHAGIARASFEVGVGASELDKAGVRWVVCYLLEYLLCFRTCA